MLKSYLIYKITDAAINNMFNNIKRNFTISNKRVYLKDVTDHMLGMTFNTYHQINPNNSKRINVGDVYDIDRAGRGKNIVEKISICMIDDSQIGTTIIQYPYVHIEIKCTHKIINSLLLYKSYLE